MHQKVLNGCNPQNTELGDRGKICCYIASVMSNSLGPHGLWLARLLCPWDCPGSNTGMGCHFLHQGIFPTHGLNPCLLRLLH